MFLLFCFFLLCVGFIFGMFFFSFVLFLVLLSDYEKNIVFSASLVSVRVMLVKR